MLVEHGVHLIENLFLDELVRDKIYEFLFVLATPKLKDGSAFPVEPVAIIQCRRADPASASCLEVRDPLLKHDHQQSKKWQSF